MCRPSYVWRTASPQGLGFSHLSFQHCVCQVQTLCWTRESPPWHMGAGPCSHEAHSLTEGTDHKHPLTQTDESTRELMCMGRMKHGPNGSDHEKGQTVQGRRYHFSGAWNEEEEEEETATGRWGRRAPGLANGLLPARPPRTRMGGIIETSYKRQSCLLGPL